MTTKIYRLRVRGALIFLSIIGMLLFSGTSVAQPLPLPGIQITDVIRVDDTTNQVALRFRLEECHTILIPLEVSPDEGGLLELIRNGNQLELRIGLVPYGTINPCGTPTNPMIGQFPFGELEAGQYELHLVGINHFDFDAEYSLDTFSFTLAPLPRAIPATDANGLGVLVACIGLLAFAVMSRQGRD